MQEWLRRVAREINRVDHELVRRSAAVPPAAADDGLKALTRAANHSLLWFAVAAALASRKGVTRRAALRGLAAIGGASFTVNAVAKPLLPRRRPAWEDVPVGRRLNPNERPNSSSFPSGHAASAAAFVTAVTMESPAIGLAVAPVAAAVTYSRVHTGVHYPFDVAAGILLGSGIALATRRWWPLRVREAPASRHLARVPALPSGDGLVVLVNPGSGADSQDPGAETAAAWPAARQVFTEPGGDLTLNHFARDIGVTEVSDAVEAVGVGSAMAVDLGGVQVDDAPPRWFVNTASLGGYPDLVQLREQRESRWGKWPAAAIALIRVLRESDPMLARIDGKPRLVWLVFVGNGLYRPRGFAAGARHRLDSGLFDIRYVRADVPLSRTRFLLGALSSALERSRTYVQQECAELLIEVLGSPVALATDGEVIAEGRRFRFFTRPAALQVYRPER
ncbi:MAG: bifunctional phosphatase PAP2/diacylglycerol kinase family protein [Pseudonocardiaceae bacterium]